jgi:hypothetical protein
MDVWPLSISPDILRALRQNESEAMLTIGTHRITMGGQEKEIHWSPVKDEWLRVHRGLGFEQVAVMIEKDDYLTIIDHWNPSRYPNQRLFILKIDDYGYYVPFVETEFEIFLKTIIQSRKATKLHLRGN